MPAITVPKDNIQYGPGYLYRAVLGSTAPTNTVVGGVFTDSWPVAWIPWGVTVEGFQWDYQLQTGQINAAEYNLPLAVVEESASANVAFNVMQMTATNTAKALNGATLTTVSGTGATTLTKLSPPAVGGSVRIMIGWESQDFTRRGVWNQCLNTGQVTVQYRKGANPSSLPLSFVAEQPATGNAFDLYYAGATVVGT